MTNRRATIRWSFKYYRGEKKNNNFQRNEKERDKMIETSEEFQTRRHE